MPKCVYSDNLSRNMFGMFGLRPHDETRYRGELCYALSMEKTMWKCADGRSPMADAYFAKADLCGGRAIVASS